MRRSLARATVASVLLLGMVACAASEPITVAEKSDSIPAITRDFLASFQTDLLDYRLSAGAIGYQADIVLTFTNMSPATAYVVNCGGATKLQLEKLVGEQWTAVWSPAQTACLSAPVIVQPLDSWTTTVHVFGGYTGCDCNPRFATDDLTGVYRLVFTDVYSSYKSATTSYSSPLPFEMRVSNRFALVPQPR